MLARIFIAPDADHLDQTRLRAGWRILIQTILMFVIALSATFALGWLVSLLPVLAPYSLLFAQLSTLIAITLSVYLARRFLDRRSMVSLGLRIGRQAARDILAGFLIAGVMMLAIYSILRSLGWLDFQGFAWQKTSVYNALLATLVMLVVFIIVGWQEELLARGYQLQNIAEGLNLFWGVILSSLFFSMAHFFNPGMGLASLIGLFLAGLFLAYAYLRTRRLWLPIGLHIGWNFFEGTVLGFPVSGLNMFRLFEQEVSGPALLTGGAFGPEAGLVLLPALALGAILVYYYTRLDASEETVD